MNYFFHFDKPSGNFNLVFVETLGNLRLVGVPRERFVHPPKKELPFQQLSVQKRPTSWSPEHTQPSRDGSSRCRRWHTIQNDHSSGWRLGCTPSSCRGGRTPLKDCLEKWEIKFLSILRLYKYVYIYCIYCLSFPKQHATTFTVHDWFFCVF